MSNNNQNISQEIIATIQKSVSDAPLSNMKEYLIKQYYSIPPHICSAKYFSTKQNDQKQTKSHRSIRLVEMRLGICCVDQLL